VLEILLPNESVVLRRTDGAQQRSRADSSRDRDSDDPANAGMNIQSAILDPNPACATKLLALAVDHIDTLLEDWYPTLGTRFVHTSEGESCTGLQKLRLND
jgi:hypothetical protein